MVRPPDPPPPPSHAVVHARPGEAARSLCGLRPGVGGWSRNRREVTCGPCQIEIGRRLMTQRWRDPWKG